MKGPIHVYYNERHSKWLVEDGEQRLLEELDDDVTAFRAGKRWARKENRPGVILYHKRNGRVERDWKNPDYNHAQSQADAVYGDDYENWYEEYANWSQGFLG